MSSRASLGGQTAIITGASAGIGQATAHALAREGVDVVLAARREDRLNRIATAVSEEYGVDTAAVPTDVTNEDAVMALVEATVERFGGPDIVVNNAGVARGSAVEDLTTEDYRTMMSVNCDGMFFLTRETLPYLRESGGTLVYLGSFAGKYPRPFNPVYAATKWWTRGFAKSVAAQVGGDDVAVTVINPSEVRTEFGASYGESFAERFEKGEATEPAEVAEAVVFAAQQGPSMANELDIYRRDKFELFGSM